jgi:DNA (cytosine-5)-methyltransferase 1
MNILRVGTDCSGIEAPIQALIQMNIPFKHVFCSDIDKYCIQSIKANYNPEIIFGDKDGDFPEGDITKRDINDVPDIDLYICGFPCQPFSMAGERKGFNDKRGNVFFNCLELIERKQPKYFILENVKGLISHDKKNTWKVICDELLKLEKYGYIVKWKILNTKDYGIPQNRERIFIVGNKEDFEWPKKKRNG